MKRVLVVVALLLTGCSTPAPNAEEPESRDRPSGTSAQSQPASPDEPLAWGPTTAELDQARALVAQWSPEQLAGQVIVGRYYGTDPSIPAQLVRDLHLAGVCVTSGNVLDETQVRATNAALTKAMAATGRDFPPVIGVDQEGGVVSHLRGIATDFPAFAEAGEAVQAAPRAGAKLVRAAARATGLELRELGFTWVFAPVADVTIGAADPTIGSRSPSTDPATAATATAAAVRGYGDSGLVSTTKHFPGHGAATADSHLTLPTLDQPVVELRKRDLPPFEQAVVAGAPSVMIGHLDVLDLAPGRPASLAPEIYTLLRDEIGFEGVAITDSLGMGALATEERPAVQAILAGADLLLMPVDTVRTHEIVTAAIASGEIPRERIEEAAARVVALQLWQARRANDVPIPADVTTVAQQAAAALAAGG